MKIKVVVHEAEEGGYWGEVPAIPGCSTQGETFEELLQNLYEAIEDALPDNFSAVMAGLVPAISIHWARLFPHSDHATSDLIVE